MHRTTQNKQYTEQHKISWKTAGRAPSLRVLPWHLPYNWGKSTEKTSVRVAEECQLARWNHRKKFSRNGDLYIPGEMDLQTCFTLFQNIYSSDKHSAVQAVDSRINARRPQ